MRCRHMTRRRIPSLSPQYLVVAGWWGKPSKYLYHILAITFTTKHHASRGFCE